MDDTLHIRCGSDIRDGLRQAGIKGDFLEFSDPFCQGPVVDSEQWHTLRSEFIARHYELALPEVEEKQRRAYQQLAEVHQYPHLVLWFEHDSYDQLILAFILTHLKPLALGYRLELICISEYPGIERFCGLGQLSPEQLKQLYLQQRQAVSSAHYADAENVWHSFVQGDVARLNHIIQSGTPSIPAMAGALKRQLQELPWTDCGLGLSAQLTVQILQDGGPRTCGKLFREITLVREPLPHLGDLMYWALLKHLAAQGVIDIAADEQDWPLRMASLQSVTKPGIAESWWVGPFDISKADCPRWNPVTGQVVEVAEA
ncbi:hypothetical protein GCM10009092_38730 [Bowmanella denitrificans]|uniref:DUF1835 domain-containing protein n=1 Tax=Bowmanella denitrificans TaxID=366582 RepID=A0ABN0XRS3_9ALTE